MNYTYPDLAKTLDRSLLHPALTADELEAGCRLARAYDVASVCILPYALQRSAKLLD
jgi:deoxyribose-phosphate aldolase